MADEIDAAQERGEVAKRNETYVQGSDISTMDDLGLDRRRISEWAAIGASPKLRGLLNSTAAVSQNGKTLAMPARCCVSCPKTKVRFPARLVARRDRSWTIPQPLLTSASASPQKMECRVSCYVCWGEVHEKWSPENFVVCRKMAMGPPLAHSCPLGGAGGSFPAPPRRGCSQKNKMRLSPADLRPAIHERATVGA
jgi:hypothetical protein